MKLKIIAIERNELRDLVQHEIQLNGNNCDLNHIDVSNVIDMSHLFRDSDFNGNISQWDTSKVINMYNMFDNSKFNGDISNWDVSRVTDMYEMFHEADFNQDISKWNVSNLGDMDFMFCNAKFKGDLSNWKPYNVTSFANAFENSVTNIPYWHSYSDLETRKQAINAYHLEKELSKDLNTNLIINKKIKI